MSHKAYSRAQKTNIAPRDAEYNAFAQATRVLMDAEEMGRENLGELAQALEKNRALWSLLASDCASTDNQLPETLRAQIINLSRWVDNYSRDVLRKAESLEPLIDINRIMMGGLSERVSEQ